MRILAGVLLVTMLYSTSVLGGEKIRVYAHWGEECTQYNSDWCFSEVILLIFDEVKQGQGLFQMVATEIFFHRETMQFVRFGSPSRIESIYTGDWIQKDNLSVCYKLTVPSGSKIFESPCPNVRWSLREFEVAEGFDSTFHVLVPAGCDGEEKLLFTRLTEQTPVAIDDVTQSYAVDKIISKHRLSHHHYYLRPFHLQVSSTAGGE